MTNQNTSFPFLNLSGCENFRDIGGIKGEMGMIRRGRVYRSGHFAALEDTDHQLISALELKTIVDLREAKECNDCPTPNFLQAANIVHLPAADIDPHNFSKQLAKPDPKEIAKQQLSVYGSRPFSRAVLWRRFFELLLNEGNYPIVFHCMLGKDRTGILAALLLGILGVPRDTIVDDYMLTGKVHNPSPNRAMTAEQIAEMYDITLEQLAAYKEVAIVRPELIEATIDAVLEHSGSYEHYFQKTLGMSMGEIDTIRRIMIV